MTTSPTTPKRPHPVDVAVGKKLKELRTMRRMSQTDVAKRLGLSFQQMQKYEIGSNRISASKLYEMSQILSVSVDEFFTDLAPKGSQINQDGEHQDVLLMIEEVLKIEDDDGRQNFLSDIAAMVAKL